MTQIRPTIVVILLFALLERLNCSAVSESTAIHDVGSSDAIRMSQDNINRTLNSLRTLQTRITLPIRINCGNTRSDYIDRLTGTVWKADSYFSGGDPEYKCDEARNAGYTVAPNDCVTREDEKFKYVIPVPYAGKYKVTLRMIETEYFRPMRRIFNISAESETISLLTNLDLYATIGSAFKPMERTFIIPCTDGWLSISFSASVRKGTISGIVIEEYIAPPIATPASNTVKVQSAPVKSPTSAPRNVPTSAPVKSPTSAPRRVPTSAPIKSPTSAPRNLPSFAPKNSPTSAPRNVPTSAPVKSPTSAPRNLPTFAPQNSPVTPQPISKPTPRPTKAPILPPTAVPTAAPSKFPINPPTSAPTNAPTSPTKTVPVTVRYISNPTSNPTKVPTSAPTVGPTVAPTSTPTTAPTSAPVAAPTRVPSLAPTMSPTSAPKNGPTSAPANSPTGSPKSAPTNAPTSAPSTAPTNPPTSSPKNAHNTAPTNSPSVAPKSTPANVPTSAPSMTPTTPPSAAPKNVPTSVPADSQPSSSPNSSQNSVPTEFPTPYLETTDTPISEPTASPSRAPPQVPVVIPVPSPVLVPNTAPIAAPVPFPTIRINAGSKLPWKDPVRGALWKADAYFGLDGRRYTNCPTNTSLHTLFCSERYYFGPPGTNGTYVIPVNPGKYTVRLSFSEIFFTGENQRVFNVYVQNRLIRANFDIYSAAGSANTTIIVSAIATVRATDANIRIRLMNIIQYAKICAFEISAYDGTVTEVPTAAPATPVPTSAPTQFQGYLINCGQTTSFEDSLGRMWLADQFHVGGIPSSNIQPIDNTVDDPLFNYDRVGDFFSYAFPLPLGTYQVLLMFAETEYNMVNQRKFDIKMENDTIYDVDIIRLAGVPSTAVRLELFALVEDGVLNIEFMKSLTFANASIPKVNAISITMDKPHISHSVATGPYYGTVGDETTGEAKVKLVGQTSHTHGDGLNLVHFTWKEGNKILGSAMNIDYNFTAGNHTISLTVEDDGGNQDTEVTTVVINPFGFPLITGLSPSNGAISGLYDVIIIGTGFTYSAEQTTVVFGQTPLTASAIQIINSTAIKVIAPPSSTTQAVGVIIRTPLGESEVFEFNYMDNVPIQWTSGKILDFLSPIVGRFGPDQKLYIGTRKGRILKVTMNADFTAAINTIVRQVNSREEAILGLAFDPLDTKSDPDVYFTFNQFFHKYNMSSSGASVGGKIRRASGPNLETVTDIITGLPVSDLDHGLNNIEFGDGGELYFTCGSFTNGGIPGKLSSSKILKENFLSGSVNVAYLSHPDFNGTIKWSALDDGNMIAKGIDVFAQGLRNPFGLVMHSNGELYCTDNGPNLGYGRMSTGCRDTDSIDDAQRSDEVNRLQKGHYYGHANRKRASYFQDPRQCIWTPPEVNSTADYTAPILTSGSSIDGIMEFHGNHFGGQLRNNLIMIRYNDANNIMRAVLTEDGTAVIPSLNKKPLMLGIGYLGLDITQAPNGNLIEMRYQNATVFHHAPVEPPTSEMIVKIAFPRRGPTGGGNTLSIYGVNLDAEGPNPSVTVGGVACPVSMVSSTRLDCTLSGGTGTVDVIVQNGMKTSSFLRGYRYISGVLPQGFVLPEYNA